MKDQNRKETKELISAIRVILKHDWDPLNEEGAFKVPDSLDSFIGPVMKLLAQPPSVEKISKILEEMKWKHSGVSTTGKIYLELPRS